MRRDRRIYVVLFPVWWFAGIILAMSWIAIRNGHLLQGLVGVVLVLTAALVLVRVVQSWRYWLVMGRRPVRRGTWFR